jgi:hypothetical protein
MNLALSETPELLDGYAELLADHLGRVDAAVEPPVTFHANEDHGQVVHGRLRQKLVCLDAGALGGHLFRTTYLHRMLPASRLPARLAMKPGSTLAVQ